MAQEGEEYQVDLNEVGFSLPSFVCYPIHGIIRQVRLSMCGSVSLSAYFSLHHTTQTNTTLVGARVGRSLSLTLLTCRFSMPSSLTSYGWLQKRKRPRLNMK